MLTTQDEERVRVIVREEIIESPVIKNLASEVRRNSILLEEQSEVLKSVAEKMDFLVDRNQRIDKLEERVDAHDVEIKALKAD